MGELDARSYEWCYRESLRRDVEGEVEGWLDPADVEAMRSRMTTMQFRVEVELQEPRAEDRVIAPAAVDLLFGAATACPRDS